MLSLINKKFNFNNGFKLYKNNIKLNRFYSTSILQAKHRSKVTLHYTTYDMETNELLETTKEHKHPMQEQDAPILNIPGLELKLDVEAEPISFIVGYDQVISGLDKGVMGMEPDSIKTLTIPKEDCYGDYIEGKTMLVPKTSLPSGIEPGSAISFEDGQTAVFKEYADDNENAIVDLNHYLAGKSLKMEIEMINVEEIPPVEILKHEPGDGKTYPKVGDKVKIHFAGYQENKDEPWDCTFTKNQPIEFPLGLGETFPGLEDGIFKMSKGETVFLNIHKDLGPGEMLRQFGVDPDLDLHIKVKLLDINNNDA